MRLLDTDTCIWLLRGDARVLEQRARILDEVATTWITASELFYGAARSRHPESSAAHVLELLNTMPILELDAVSCRIFGEAKALLERRGERLSDADLLIGAMAAARGAVLVTGNVRHFSRMPGVTLESWLRP
ncbi:MAG: PIN domain-containing protein [Anaeromyxobacteraceae bacterium]